MERVAQGGRERMVPGLAIHWEPINGVWGGSPTRGARAGSGEARGSPFTGEGRARAPRWHPLCWSPKGGTNNEPLINIYLFIKIFILPISPRVSR